MRILDQAFSVAKDLYYADRFLQYTARSARWFPEFTSVNFTALRFMFDLLKHFLRHDICCHVDGSFPTYLAGLQTAFHTVTFSIALKNSPLINLIFQSGEALRETFYVGRLHFSLHQNLQHIDVSRYVVRRGNLQYWISFLGIES